MPPYLSSVNVKTEPTAFGAKTTAIERRIYSDGSGSVNFGVANQGPGDLVATRNIFARGPLK